MLEVTEKRVGQSDAVQLCNSRVEVGKGGGVHLIFFLKHLDPLGRPDSASS